MLLTVRQLNILHFPDRRDLRAYVAYLFVQILHT
jgi:hypothetical protein